MDPTYTNHPFDCRCSRCQTLAREQAEFLNVAFHMQIRKLERVIRRLDPTNENLPENMKQPNKP